MNIFLFLLLILLILFYLLKIYQKRLYENSLMPPLIPGSIPICGNYFDIDYKQPHISLTRLSRDFRQAFTLTIFGRRIVVLNTHEAIHELFSQQSRECSERPLSYLLNVATQNQKDFVFSKPNKRWLRIRSLFHKSFMDMNRMSEKCHISELVFSQEWSGSVN